MSRPLPRSHGKRTLVTAAGYQGDVLPFVSVARELVAPATRWIWWSHRGFHAARANEASRQQRSCSCSAPLSGAVGGSGLRRTLATPTLATLSSHPQGLPPLLVIAGGAESLLSCAQQIASNANRDGVPATSGSIPRSARLDDPPEAPRHPAGNRRDQHLDHRAHRSSDVPARSESTY